MTTGSGTASAVRTICTVVVALLATVVLFYCVLLGVWVLSTAGSPGVGAVDVLWPAAGLGAIALLTIGAVVGQVRWANRATTAGAVVRRTLLVLAAPAAVLLVFALRLII